MTSIILSLSIFILAAILLLIFTYLRSKESIKIGTAETLGEFIKQNANSGNLNQNKQIFYAGDEKREISFKEAKKIVSDFLSEDYKNRYKSFGFSKNDNFFEFMGADTNKTFLIRIFINKSESIFSNNLDKDKVLRALEVYWRMS